MKIGLAQVRFPKSAAEGAETVENCMKQAAEEGCNLVCFPESIVPGLRGVGFEVETYNHEIQQNTLYKVKLFAKQLKLNVILPLEWRDELGMHLTAFVIDENGKELGYQTKNQIDPAEDEFGYKPGNGRWAAVRGASIVFHPQFTGEVPDPQFYDYAMIARSTENGIYFASVNYALENQKSTTSLLSPKGECLIKAKAEKQELLTYTIEPGEANHLLAQRLLSNLLL